MTMTDFAATVDRIRADSTLSEEGKRQLLARAWLKANDAVRREHSSQEEGLVQERKRLEGRFFRAPVSLHASSAERIAVEQSFRDALDRASRTGGSQLADLLRRAQRSEDKVQVRAVVATAIGRRDMRTLNAYTEVHPTDEEPLQRLLDLSAPRSATARMADAMKFAPPPVPTELAGTSEATIRAVAEGRGLAAGRV